MSKRDLGSDLAKVDAHEITAEEYEEIPEVDEAAIARARARGLMLMDPTALRLDDDLADRLRAIGEGWQARVNIALREWADKIGA